MEHAPCLSPERPLKDLKRLYYDKCVMLFGTPLYMMGSNCLYSMLRGNAKGRLAANIAIKPNFFAFLFLWPCRHTRLARLLSPLAVINEQVRETVACILV